MAQLINRKCPFCGSQLSYDFYPKMPHFEAIAYCENVGCEQFCTNSTYPSAVLAELEQVEEKLCNKCVNCDDDGYCHECDTPIEYIDIVNNECLCFGERLD